MVTVVQEITELIGRARTESRQLGSSFEVQAAIALRLAHLLEDEMYCHICERGGALPKEASALSKELRSIVDAIADGLQRDGDENPFGAALPAALLDASQPGPPDPGPGGGGGSKKARIRTHAVAKAGS